MYRERKKEIGFCCVLSSSNGNIRVYRVVRRTFNLRSWSECDSMVASYTGQSNTALGYFIALLYAKAD